MTPPPISLSGQVVRGHRIASGRCGDPRFPKGTIAPQLPYFETINADFTTWLNGPAWAGTINIALSGMTVSPRTPDVVVGPIAWSQHFPPERFLLSRCILVHKRTRHHAWLYMPDPATKPDHHQPANLVEILTHRLNGLSYGDPVSLELSPRLLVLSAGAASTNGSKRPPPGHA